MPSLLSQFVFMLALLTWINKEESRQKHKHRIAIRRNPRWAPWDDLDHVSDSAFNQMFRLSRDDFNWLVSALRPSLHLDVLRRGDPFSVELQVAIGLYRLAQGVSFVQLGHLFNIGKESANATCRQFVDAINYELHDLTIGFPKLDETDKWNSIKASFSKTRGIPNIVGAIDGTHIPIKEPANDSDHCYINRKGWASITFQCVVDGDGYFRDVYGGLPGSVHDSRVFRLSDLGSKLINGEQVFPPGKELIRDSGYPENVCVMTPYPSAKTEEHKEFHFIHSSTRMVVKHTFGRLKNRFRVLKIPQAVKPEVARNTAIACMVLHNILSKRGALYLQNWDMAVDPDNKIFSPGE